jgi:hypothetical protein
VVFKEDLFVTGMQIFDVLTEINSDGIMENIGAVKSARVFADDMAIKNGQRIPDLRLQT